ncbi:MAG: glycerol-3-phosphate 1-O-acyltransferase PlsY [Clostridia bacterium]|nr:glycerol-3-phosphate 1-O-acyltransferase PlsY [Clostridia bacterium]
MLQFFAWLWRVTGVSDALGYAAGTSFPGFAKHLFYTLILGGNTGGAYAVYIGMFLVLIVVPYLLGSLNGAILVSRYVFHDDIRNHGSGNAGLTNMGRVFGKKGALLTFAIDFAKQFLAVVIGILLCGETGAYLAGLFCMVGHIAPVFFRFKGGKGVLTAGVMILLIDYQVFLIDFALFAIVVLISRYVSLGSVIAGFALPGVVWILSSLRGNPSANVFPMIFAAVIGLMLILMHRSNLRRLSEGTENKLSFRKKKEPSEEEGTAETAGKK